jgi:hypothetical protein
MWPFINPKTADSPARLRDVVSVTIYDILHLSGFDVQPEFHHGTSMRAPLFLLFFLRCAYLCSAKPPHSVPSMVKEGLRRRIA